MDNQFDPSRSRNLEYNSGYANGLHSKKLKRPIHQDWKTRCGYVHFNPDYVKGYEDGYGIKLNVTIKRSRSA